MKKLPQTTIDALETALAALKALENALQNDSEDVDQYIVTRSRRWRESDVCAARCDWAHKVHEAADGVEALIDTLTDLPRESEA